MRTRAVVVAGIVLSIASGCTTGRNAGSKTALGAGVGLLLASAAILALPSETRGDCTHGDTSCAGHDASSDDVDREFAAVLAGAGLATLLLAAVTYDPTPEPIYVSPPTAYVPPPPPPPETPHEPPPPVTINCTVCIFH